MRISKIILPILILTSQACSMNELLGKPQVKSSKLGPDKYSVMYVQIQIL